MGKITEEEYKSLFIKIVCRLCGQEWLYPPELAKQFDSDHGLECSYCKGRRRRCLL